MRLDAPSQIENSRLKGLKLIIPIFLLVIAALDAGFKSYALRHLPDEQAAPLQPILDFAVHKNLGIAFNIPVPLGVVIPITGLICLIFARIAYKQWGTKPKQSLAALTAVVGALGNGIDRILHNFTTDYIILFRTSAINLSDVLILVGIIGILWYDQRIPSQRQT
ncbi:MAG: signal peptidase II [Patescibacteria group bacterium]